MSKLQLGTLHELYEDMVIAWQTSDSLDEISEKVGLSKSYLIKWRYDLVHRGVVLKKLEKRSHGSHRPVTRNYLPYTTRWGVNYLQLAVLAESLLLLPTLTQEEAMVLEDKIVERFKIQGLSETSLTYKGGEL